MYEEGASDMNIFLKYEDIRNGKKTRITHGYIYVKKYHIRKQSAVPNS